MTSLHLGVQQPVEEQAPHESHPLKVSLAHGLGILNASSCPEDSSSFAVPRRATVGDLETQWQSHSETAPVLVSLADRLGIQTGNVRQQEHYDPAGPDLSTDDAAAQAIPASKQPHSDDSFMIELAKFVSSELGVDTQASLSSCVFCKSSFCQSPRPMENGRCEVKVLPCLHSACGPCLDELLKTQKDLQCPVCEARSMERTFGRYLSNFHALQAIDQRRVADQKPLTCEECIEAAPAEQHCADCVRNLCAECSAHHRRSKGTRMHIMEALSQRREGVLHRTAVCQLHPERPASFFCETCSVMCCHECALNEHDEHNYRLPVGSLVDQRRQGLSEHLQLLSDLGAELQARHRSLDGTIGDCDHTYEAARRNIEELETQVNEALCQRRQAMQQENNVFMAEHRMIFDKKCASLTAMMVSLWGAISFVDEVLTKGTKMEVLLLKSQISALEEKCFAMVDTDAVEAPSRVRWQGHTLPVLSAIRGMGVVNVGHSVMPVNLTLLSSLEDTQRIRPVPIPCPIIGLPDVTDSSSVCSRLQDMQDTASEKPVSCAGRADSADAALHSIREAGELPSAEPAVPAPPATSPEETRGGTEAPGGTAHPPARPAERPPLTVSLADSLGVSARNPHAGAPVTAKPLMATISLSAAIGSTAPRQLRSGPAGWPAAGVHALGDGDVSQVGLGRMQAALGQEGDGPGSFRSPYGICVDGTQIYVCDTQRHHILVFNRATFEYIGQVSLAGIKVDNLTDPSGLCATEDGRLVVLEYSLDRILLVRLGEGSLEAVAAWKRRDLNLSAPFGAASIRDRVVVTDTCNHSCVVLNLTGQLLFRFGSRGNRPGEFEYPVGVALFRDGSIAVTDKGNHRVQIFDSQGVFQNIIPRTWSKDSLSCLRSPMGMATDKRDRLYVCDCGNHRLQVFTREGHLLWSSDDVGLPARTAAGEPLQFCHPTGVAIDDTGRVYVAGDHYVYIF